MLFSSMLFSSAVSSSMSPIPYGDIPGFDAIPSDVMGCIGEYAGCLGIGEGGDRPSWSLYRDREYVRVLFAPRINPVRLGLIVQLDNELNKGYASYQNYKRVENCWKITNWLLSNNYATDFDVDARSRDLKNIVDIRIYRGFYSSPTLRQYWFNYLHPAFTYSQQAQVSSMMVGIAVCKWRESGIQDIQSVCDVLSQENNGAAGVLSAIFPSTRETFEKDMASYEVQSARNVQSRSIFKKALACNVAGCLISRRIVSQVVPFRRLQQVFYNKEVVRRALLSIGISVLAIGTYKAVTNGPQVCLVNLNNLASKIARDVPLFIAGSVAVLHIGVHASAIRSSGLARAWEFRKNNFKSMIAHIQDIWSFRELITDVYLEGAIAHASIARESIRQLGLIQGLRHGFRVLSRIARQGRRS